MVRNAMSIKQIEYKNAELVLCEFMATQDYNVEEWQIPKYEDFSLQELHDFITDKIDALDAYIDRYQWKRGNYKTKQG